MDAFLASASDAEISVAMVHYSFLVQAYVWGEDDPPKSLPANLAVPIDALAEKLGQAPLLPYSGYVLDNWYRLDKSAPISLDNIAMKQNFLGGMDENWFVLIHVAIEAEAGRALEIATELVAASDDGDEGKVEALLVEMNSVWDRINAHFDRMPDRCDPYIYYQRVRPFIHGWKNNPATPDGIVYEGVARYGDQPQAFRGQTGSQSSIVPAMDALFNVSHENDPLREYLDELHAYRPIAHRRFIEDLAEASRLRGFASNARDGVKGCVQRLCRAGRPLPHPPSRICGQLYQQTGLIGRRHRYRCRHRRYALHEISEETSRREPRTAGLAVHPPSPGHIAQPRVGR